MADDPELARDELDINDAPSEEPDRVERMGKALCPVSADRAPPTRTSVIQASKPPRMTAAGDRICTYVGLKPKMPVKLAGRMIDPPYSTTSAAVDILGLNRSTIAKRVKKTCSVRSKGDMTLIIRNCRCRPRR